MDHAEKAAQERLRLDGDEIAAVIGANIAAQADREGRAIAAADFAAGIGPLLCAVWHLVKLADDDADGGRVQRYAAFLRKHAEAVETS